MSDTERVYSVNEIFYSLQGEGHRAGTANVFVRFAGCNLTCRRETEGFDCDTEFTSGVSLTAAEILSRAREFMGNWGNVIFTGGEPLLQYDLELHETFHGWIRCAETNGTVALPDGVDFEYLACCPKTAEHTLRITQCEELRYVRNKGQGLPKPSIRAANFFLSPAFEADGGIESGALADCIKLVRANRKWRLSVQQHKAWGVR